MYVCPALVYLIYAVHLVVSTAFFSLFKKKENSPFFFFLA